MSAQVIARPSSCPSCDYCACIFSNTTQPSLPIISISATSNYNPVEVQFLLQEIQDIEYVVTSTCTNCYGTSIPSLPYIMPAGTSLPASPSITAQKNALDPTNLIVYATPGSNGGCMLESITAIVKPYGCSVCAIDGLCRCVSATLSPLVGSVPYTLQLAGLSPSTKYSLTSTATNCVGSSIPSAPLIVEKSTTLPGPPTIESTTRSQNRLELSVEITPPANDGFCAITGYRVTALPANCASCAQSGSCACIIVSTNAVEPPVRVLLNVAANTEYSITVSCLFIISETIVVYSYKTNALYCRVALKIAKELDLPAIRSVQILNLLHPHPLSRFTVRKHTLQL